MFKFLNIKFLFYIIIKKKQIKNMQQEFRLYNTECVKIVLPEEKKALYFSSFRKAAKCFNLNCSTLISSFKNDNGWRIWNKQPIKINIVNITDETKNLIDNELNC